ncbi:hypothetical protein V8E36_001118 [Tilletia maclaganii]
MLRKKIGTDRRLLPPPFRLPLNEYAAAQIEARIQVVESRIRQKAEAYIRSVLADYSNVVNAFNSRCRRNGPKEDGSFEAAVSSDGTYYFALNGPSVENMFGSLADLRTQVDKRLQEIENRLSRVEASRRGADQVAAAPAELKSTHLVLGRLVGTSGPTHGGDGSFAEKQPHRQVQNEFRDLVSEIADLKGDEVIWKQSMPGEDAETKYHKVNFVPKVYDPLKTRTTVAAEGVSKEYALFRLDFAKELKGPENDRLLTMVYEYICRNSHKFSIPPGTTVQHLRTILAPTLTTWKDEYDVWVHPNGAAITEARRQRKRRHRRHARKVEKRREAAGQQAGFKADDPDYKTIFALDDFHSEEDTDPEDSNSVIRYAPAFRSAEAEAVCRSVDGPRSTTAKSLSDKYRTRELKAGASLAAPAWAIGTSWYEANKDKVRQLQENRGPEGSARPYAVSYGKQELGSDVNAGGTYQPGSLASSFVYPGRASPDRAVARIRVGPGSEAWTGAAAATSATTNTSQPVRRSLLLPEAETSGVGTSSPLASTVTSSRSDESSVALISRRPLAVGLPASARVVFPRQVDPTSTGRSLSSAGAARSDSSDLLGRLPEDLSEAELREFFREIREQRIRASTGLDATVGASLPASGGAGRHTAVMQPPLSSGQSPGGTPSSHPRKRPEATLTEAGVTGPDPKRVRLVVDVLDGSAELGSGQGAVFGDATNQTS